eukprot:6752541-Prorocentrum_lima.AAC.1
MKLVGACDDSWAGSLLGWLRRTRKGRQRSCRRRAGPWPVGHSLRCGRGVLPQSRFTLPL